MKIWIDILTPKQTLFFDGIAQELLDRGHDILITVRRFRETNALYNKYIKDRYRNYLVGIYGGKELKNKLLASINRMKKLIAIIDRERPDIAISFTSPDAARVAYGLGIKHISVSDTPHAEAASKLSIPLSIRLYTPWIIPKKRWVIYGISSEKIYQYRGLDPIVWIKRHKDDEYTLKIINKIGIPYIIIRPIEWMASYQLNTDYSKMIRVTKLVKELNKIDPKLKIVILPRYSKDIFNYKQSLKEIKTIYIPKKPLDGPTLVKHSVGLIGYGGTMTMESGLMGKLTITVRPGEQPIYLKYLIKRGLVHRCTTLKQIKKLLTLHMENGYKDLDTKEELSQMEDPATYIADTISTI